MTTKHATVAFSILALAFAGCETAKDSSNLNSVHLGMTKADLVATLGKADQVSAQANVEYLTYFLSKDAGAPKQPYMVRIVDSRVDSFGRFIQLLDTHGGTTGGAPGMGIGAVMPYSMNTDVVTQLQQLKWLKDQGVLSDEEFQKVKQRLLSDPK